MQLDNVTVAIRPRKDWEAIDLGFRMVQQWWRPIYATWLLTVLPFALLVNALLWGHPMLAAFIVWLCKPLYERIPLYIVSRAVFGEMPPISQTLKAVPRLWLSKFFIPLTFYRLDFSRSFSWPVRQLEGLKGKARRERAAILQKQTFGSAANLTISGFIFEFIIAVSVLGLMIMFIPNHLLQRYFIDLFTGSDALAGQYLITASILVAHLIIGPFYTAGGFALYINRRTQLEAWDIEIAFRRIANRTHNLLRPTKKVAIMLFALLLVDSVFLPDTAYAKQYTDLSNKEAKTIIENVKSSKDFNAKRTISYWKAKNKTEEKKSEEDKKDDSDFDMSWLDFLKPLSSLLGTTTQTLLWIAALALVAIIIIAFIMWLPALKTPLKGSASRQKNKPKYLFGMEVAPESLPEHINEAALKLLDAGKLQAAMSLLYRGALSHFIHHLGVNLKGSATEGDCVRTIKDTQYNLAQQSIQYFQLLTFNWQLLAYAHRKPDIQTLTQLCKDWPQHFEVSA